MAVLKKVSLFFILMLAIHQEVFYSAVTISNDTIICCAPWDATIIVTDSFGKPMPLIQIHLRVIDTEGNERVVPTLQTDREGKAKIYYKPTPGEALNIIIDEPWMKYNLLIPVKTPETFPIYPVMIVVGSTVGIVLVAVIVKKLITSKFYINLKSMQQKFMIKAKKSQPELGPKVKKQHEESKQQMFGFGHHEKSTGHSKWVFATKSTNAGKKPTFGSSLFTKKK